MGLCHETVWYFASKERFVLRPDYSICHLVPCETFSGEVRAVSEETIDDQIIQFIDAKVYEIPFMIDGEFC